MIQEIYMYAYSILQETNTIVLQATSLTISLNEVVTLWSKRRLGQSNIAS